MHIAEFFAFARQRLFLRDRIGRQSSPKPVDDRSQPVHGTEPANPDRALPIQAVFPREWVPDPIATGPFTTETGCQRLDREGKCLVLDYGTSPPEITSTKMYSGPGSGPLLAAAAAYDALAAQLESFATGYTSVIAGLQGEVWAGPASAAMAAAVAPYAEWVEATAVQVEHAAGQARAAAAAYETAHAATVPPALVTANRTQLARLVATNLLGQNTPQIAATEFEYSEMWAQDAVAMYGYATSASAATRLSPFREPPPIADPTGGAAQSAAVVGAAGNASVSNSQALLSGLLTALPEQLGGLSTGGSAALPAAAALPAQVDEFPIFAGIEAINILTGPSSFGLQAARTVSAVGAFAVGGGTYLLTHGGHAGIGGAASAVGPLLASQTAPVAMSGAADGRHSAVLASVGEAAPVGQLTVPQAWADATPVATASVDPQWLSEDALEADSPSQEANMAGASPAMGLGPMAGAMAGAMMRQSVTSMLRVGPRRFKMPRPSSGG